MLNVCSCLLLLHVNMHDVWRMSRIYRVSCSDIQVWRLSCSYEMVNDSLVEVWLRLFTFYNGLQLVHLLLCIEGLGVLNCIIGLCVGRRAHQWAIGIPRTHTHIPSNELNFRCTKKNAAQSTVQVDKKLQGGKKNKRQIYIKLYFPADSAARRFSLLFLEHSE